MDFGPQFGAADSGVDHVDRPAAFGVVERDGALACVRITTDRGQSWIDLPGGALDPGEDDARALVREFCEETGLRIQPGQLFARASQRFRKTDGQAVNNRCAFFTAEVLSHDPAAKVEDDHELIWMDPVAALKVLRHDAHAWAVAAWLRRERPEP